MLKNIQKPNKYLIVHYKVLEDPENPLPIYFPIWIWKEGSDNPNHLGCSKEEINKILISKRTTILVPDDFEGVAGVTRISRIKGVGKSYIRDFFNKYAVRR